MTFSQRLVLVALPVVLLCGQSTPLTKEQIIQLYKAGLPDDVIVARIKAAPNPVQLSTDDLVTLKTAGVSDSVIRALVASGPETGSANPPAGDPNDPAAPHDPGLYLLTVSRGGGTKLVQMERAGASHEKTAHILTHVATAGIVKGKIKAEIPGPRATVRSAEPKPVFYMYFPSTGNLGSADTITSPSQFSLMSLEAKKDHRETTVEKIGFASASAGIDEKRVFKFVAEKVRPYVYRIIPDGSLQSGEYAFIAATGMGGTASAASVVVFDFGVELK